MKKSNILLKLFSTILDCIVLIKELQIVLQLLTCQTLLIGLLEIRKSEREGPITPRFSSNQRHQEFALRFRFLPMTSNINFELKITQIYYIQCDHR